VFSKREDGVQSNPLYDGRNESEFANPLFDNDFREGNAVEVLTTKVEKNASISIFNIPRNSTIQSDKKPHKVTISVIELKPKFTYTVIPQKSLHAYLRTKANNTSDFVLLPGPVNVFLGSTFVTKSEVKKIVNLKENLSLFCGVDSAVSVDYKERTLNEKVGTFTSSNKQTFKQTITLKNSKEGEVEVSCFSQLPLSSDQKVKVTLVSPKLSNDIKLNDFNNLNYFTKVTRNHVIEIEYTIEYPNATKLNFVE